MTNRQKIDFDELVFEKRNRHYGAYALRKRYDEHLLSGLLAGVAFVAGMTAIPYLADYWGKTPALPDISVAPPTMYTLTQVIMDPVEKPKPGEAQQAKSGGQSQTVANRTFTVGAETRTDVPTSEELRNVQPGLQTQPGDGGLPGDDNNGGGGTGGTEEGDTGDGKDKGYSKAAELQPEFPGGETALYRYLRSNIVYPERAKQMGIEGTVYIRFVVDEYGNVRFAELARGIGGGCDEEALRVVKKMPRWIPARQAGLPVKVQFYLPINYALQ